MRYLKTALVSFFLLPRAKASPAPSSSLAKITRKKRSQGLTLVEMLIVIALIGMIASALAVNLGGGLRKGQEFKTQQGKKKIKNILQYEIVEKMRDPKEVAEDWTQVVTDSPLRDQDVPIDELLNDGYGQLYEVVYDDESGDIRIYSSKDQVQN